MKHLTQNLEATPVTPQHYRLHLTRLFTRTQSLLFLYDRYEVVTPIVFCFN